MLGGLGIGHGAKATVSRLCEAAVSLETGLQDKTGLLGEANVTLQLFWGRVLKLKSIKKSSLQYF